MTRTTPPPSHRVADLFPALAGRERVTATGMGSIFVFVCRTCPGWPIAQVYQR
jgi:hypothetical protein